MASASCADVVPQPLLWKRFEPHARTPVEVRYRRGYLIFHDVALQEGLVAAGSLVPALGAEIVAELAHIAPAATVVAAEDEATLLMPVVERLEEILLAERHAHVVVVHAYFGCIVAEVEEEGVDYGHYVVGLAAAELIAEIIAPDIAVESEIQLIGKEKLRPF